MSILSVISGFIPKALAATIDQIGTADPAVSQMWAIIRGIFPYTNVGAAFPALILGKVIAFVLSLVGGVAVCVLIYAGIQLITGGEEKKAEAKKTATHALIGVVLALLADAIVLYLIKLVEVAFVGT